MPNFNSLPYPSWAVGRGSPKRGGPHLLIWGLLYQKIPSWPSARECSSLPLPIFLRRSPCTWRWSPLLLIFNLTSGWPFTQRRPGRSLDGRLQPSQAFTLPLIWFSGRKIHSIFLRYAAPIYESFQLKYTLRQIMTQFVSLYFSGRYSLDFCVRSPCLWLTHITMED